MEYRRTRGARRRALLALCAALASFGALTAATRTAQAATLPKLNVAISKSSISVSGTNQAGAVEVVSTGPKDTELILFHLNAGVAPSSFLKALEGKASQDPNEVIQFGTIAFDGPASQGVVTALQPGDYVAVFSEGEHGPSPKVNATFTIVPSAAPAAMPAAQATVRTIEFGFRGPAVLHEGELVNFTNEGFLVHMDVGFRAKSKNAARKLASALVRGKEKQAGKLIAGEPVSFFGPISRGVIQQERITANPGWYVEACFMDTQDGREHTRVGMVRVIRIVK